jgi:hypothetical protein
MYARGSETAWSRTKSSVGKHNAAVRVAYRTCLIECHRAAEEIGGSIRERAGRAYRDPALVLLRNGDFLDKFEC